jgi:hypothetical protein
MCHRSPTAVIQISLQRKTIHNEFKLQKIKKNKNRVKKVV